MRNKMPAASCHIVPRSRVRVPLRASDPSGRCPCDEVSARRDTVAESDDRLLTHEKPDQPLWTYCQEAAEHRRAGWPDFAWEDARIEVLEALGRGDEAQAARRSRFEPSLYARHLRGYLKRLTDHSAIARQSSKVHVLRDFSR
jgi:hypothetical protein